MGALSVIPYGETTAALGAGVDARVELLLGTRSLSNTPGKRFQGTHVFVQSNDLG